MVTIRIIIGAVGFLTAMVGVAFANVAMSRMVERVNRVRPLNAHINDGFWYPGKAERVKNLYRLAEPNGKQINQQRLGIAGMVIGFVALAGSFVYL